MRFNNINQYDFLFRKARESSSSLTAFYPSRSQCGSSSCDISARAAPIRKRAFYRLLRTVGRDSLADTPCLFVKESGNESSDYSRRDLLSAVFMMSIAN